MTDKEQAKQPQTAEEALKQQAEKPIEERVKDLEESLMAFGGTIQRLVTALSRITEVSANVGISLGFIKPQEEPEASKENSENKQENGEAKESK